MRLRRPSRRVLASAVATSLLAVALVVLPAGNPPAFANLADTSTRPCYDWTLYIDLPLRDIELYDIMEGWVYADDSPANRFKSITGVATGTKVAHIDFAAMHDSHDVNVNIKVDPQYQHLVSPVNGDHDMDGTPDTIEVEWELGTFPNERQRYAPERYFPKWAWPNIGDRVWTNGHWIVDCGHASEKGGKTYYRSEIHPPRAIASMRDQVSEIPGSGLTPVRVVATDLYIHGRAGYVVDVLACGQGVILRADPDSCPTKTTPIDDLYEFDIPLPPRPASGASLRWQVVNGPGHSINGVQPVLTPVPAHDPTHLRATIDLRGSGAVPEDVYAKQIYAGWVSPEPMRLLNYTLHRMDLEDDKDVDPGDCECTFFWHNINRVPHAEWIRFQDHTTGNMDDYDDWHGFGDGLMHFEDISYDFWVAPGQDFTIRARGYDQDCFDHALMNGSHRLQIPTTIDCYAGTGLFSAETGKNDKLNDLDVTFGPPTYGVGYHEVPADINTATFGDRTFELTNGYELEMTIAEKQVPAYVTTSDLDVAQTCTPDGHVAAGAQAQCRIDVTNRGPGLPRGLVVTNQVTSSNGVASVGAALYDYDGLVPGPGSCAGTAAGAFECAIGTVPVGSTATITYPLTAVTGGTFTATATAVAQTTEPNPGNNTGTDTVTALALTLSPPDATHELGTPGQAHTVTATLDAGGPVVGESVTFNVVSGPNQGAAGSAITNALGTAAFTYPAMQGPAGLGADTIRACVSDGAGGSLCAESLARWVDTTPPARSCPPGPNPSGTTPKGFGGDNGARFFTLLASDAVDPAPSVFVLDTGSGYVFGPFPSGTNVKYVVRQNAEPRQEAMTGAVHWQLSGTGDPQIRATDASGNQSTQTACPSR